MVWYGADQGDQSLEARINGASSNDERLRLAIEAAELALKAIKLAAAGRAKESMREKASDLLRQAEAFKKGQNGPLQELPVRTKTSTPLLDPQFASPKDTTRWAGSLASRTTNGETKLPKSRRELAKSEQILLMRGSKLNGCKFPPFGATPNAHDFLLEPGAPLYP